jgi:hypothetical protein
MKFFRGVCLAICLLPGSVALAQDSLVGRYTGGFSYAGALGDTLLGVTLVIASVEGDQVKGSVDLNSRGPCAGVYPMQGRLKQGTMTLRGKGGIAGDCGFRLDLTQQGSKLVGTVGPKKTPIELSK